MELPIFLNFMKMSPVNPLILLPVLLVPKDLDMS